MKSADEWLNEMVGDGADDESVALAFIRSIQADAIKSTDVDLRDLEYNIRILREALINCTDDEECEYDRNGFYQTHNCVEPCYNDVALQVLIAT